MCELGCLDLALGTMLHSWLTLVVKLVGSRITLEITFRHISKIELTEVGRVTLNLDSPFPFLGAEGERKLSTISKSFCS